MLAAAENISASAALVIGISVGSLQLPQSSKNPRRNIVLMRRILCNKVMKKSRALAGKPSAESDLSVLTHFKAGLTLIHQKYKQIDSADQYSQYVLGVY